MKKSEKLIRRPADKRKINYKGFLLANVLTLFFALAPALPAGGSNVLAADNFFDFNKASAYSEPFSKLIEFLNEKKNELEKYDGDFLGAKALLIDTGLRGSKSGVDEAALNPDISSFLANVLGSVKDTMKNVFDSAKSFVFLGPNQNGFEYNSPTSESVMREMENLKQQYAEVLDETKAISQNFNLLQNELEKIKDSGVVVRQPIVEQRVVERTIEKIVSGLSQNDLDSGIASVRAELNNLNTNLTNQLNTLSASSNRQTSAVYQAVSLTNKIDSLSGTRLSNITVSGVSGLADSDIPDTITASNYLPLAGGTLTGALTGVSASFSSTLTVSASTTLNGVEYKWPSADGTVNQTLVTNGAGGLSWTTISSGASSDWNKQTNYGVLTLTPTTTIPIWAKDAIYASSTLTAQGLATFGNASTSQISATNSYLGTVLSGTWNGTAVANNYGGTGLDSSALTGLAQITAGTWSASSTLSTAFGGTGWGNLQANTVLLGNGAGRLATTTAGTDGYVLGLSAGVPTWLATSTLSTITGTLAVGKGGTGQTSFGQGWLASDGTTLTSSTSPTVNYLMATSTTATSTFAGGLKSDRALQFTNFTNCNLDTDGNGFLVCGSDASGSGGVPDWNKQTNYGVLTLTPTTTIPIWAKDAIYASSTLTAQGLATFGNASTSQISATNSYLGTVLSGTWNGTAVANNYGGTGLDSSALTGLAQITAGTWSASSTLSTAFGGTGWGNLQANTVLLGNGAGRLATTTAGTDGYVLGLSAGVPTWLATSTLSTITGTLAVAKGGTGAATLTGLLQGNGTSAITGITGTAGQFPYYNGTDTLLATSSLFLATSGNVGIGTTSPNSKLTVYNGSADSAIEFSSASGSTYKWTIGLDYSDAGKFKIASSTALGSIDRFTIDGNGYVGIGTSTPARRLDVADSGNNNPQMRLSRETDIYTDFSVAQTTGDLSLTLNGGSANDINLYQSTGGGGTGANLWVCEGTACQSGITLNGGGNLVLEGDIKYSTSTVTGTRIKRSAILTAAGAIIPSSGGSTKTQVDGTNVSYYVLDFADAASNSAFWEWVMPDSYDGGQVDATFYWKTTSASTTAVVWCFQTQSVATTTTSIDSSMQAAKCQTQTPSSANATYVWSGTISTTTPNYSGDRYTIFKVYRDGTNGADTLAENARLLKVKLEYGVSQESD